jgi:hypothetical protein
MTARRSRLGQAAEWRLLSLLCERPRAGWHEEVTALAAEVHDRRLRRAARTAMRATEGEYLRWFGPGGTVSPRAVTYRPFEDPGQILADLAVWFDAFAFRPRHEDPLDHVAVEAGFVGFLLLKEAYAAACHQRDAAKRLRAARARFVAVHLAPLLAGLHQRLAAFGTSYPALCIEALAMRAGPPARAAVSLPHPAFPSAGCAPCAAHALGVVDPRVSQCQDPSRSAEALPFADRASTRAG